MALNYISKKLELPAWTLSKSKCGGWVSEHVIEDNHIKHLILMKPKEFMNFSGVSVKKSGKYLIKLVN